LGQISGCLIGADIGLSDWGRYRAVQLQFLIVFVNIGLKPQIALLYHLDNAGTIQVCVVEWIPFFVLKYVVVEQKKKSWLYLCYIVYTYQVFPSFSPS
jgi:hypothetical protein